MSVLRRKKAAQSQDRASCKDSGDALLHPLAKPVKPSDDALMRGGLRLRKFVLLGSRICLSLNLVRMQSPYAATTGQSCIKFTPIALCFAIKIYKISFSVGAKNFIKLHFKICGTGTYRPGRQAKIKSQNSKRQIQKTLAPSVSAAAVRAR